MGNFLLEHLFELLLTVAVGALGASFRVLLREVRHQQTEREAIKSLLRSQLIAARMKYTERGEIPIYALELVQKMYALYHTLGGNGTVTKLVEEVMSLPTQRH